MDVVEFPEVILLNTGGRINGEFSGVVMPWAKVTESFLISFFLGKFKDPWSLSRSISIVLVSFFFAAGWIIDPGFLTKEGVEKFT